MPKETWTLLTPPNMGAIAIIQLPSSALPKLTNKTEWEIGKLYLVSIPDIDDAVGVKVTDAICTHHAPRWLAKYCESSLTVSLR